MGWAIATKYSGKAKTGICYNCIVSQPPTHTCAKKTLYHWKLKEILLEKNALRDIMVHPLVNFSRIVVICLLLIKNVQFQLLEFSCHLKASISSLLRYSLAGVA